MEWVEFLSWACIVITLVGYMAGLPMCFNIIGKKSTQAIPFLPFLIGFVTNMGCLSYGIRIWDFPTLVCNTTHGCLKAAFTVQVFVLADVGMISFYLYLTQIVVASADITYQLGLTVSTLILIWNISPILEIREVMHKESSDVLSPHLSLAMLLTNICWGLYGQAIGDIFIAGPCIPGIFTGAMQLFLLYRYPAGKTVKTE